MRSVTTDLRTHAVSASSALAPAIAAVVVATLAAANGGFFAPAWGWAGVALAWGLGAFLVFAEIRLGRLEWLAVGCLAAYVVLGMVSTVWGELTVGVSETQRTLLYPVGLLVVLGVSRSSTARPLVGSVAAAGVVISTYGLLTWLFPEAGTRFAHIGGGRLSEPLGYWNALGIFSVLTLVLTSGLAAHARSPVRRFAAGAPLPLLAATIYFTYSRGAWVALALALAAVFVLDPMRVEWLATAILTAVPCAVAIALADGKDSLNRTGASLAAARADGRSLAIWLLALAALSGGIAATTWFGRKILASRAAAVVAYGVVVLVSVGFIVGASARYGGPDSWLDRARASFESPPVSTRRPGTRLTQRLFTLSNNGRTNLWRVALDDFDRHPWLGSGAGTYQRVWNRHRDEAFGVVDAHSLYLETLAELGVAGFALLAIALALPLVALVRARREPLAAVAAAAYIAFLAHSAIDWEWEMPAIALAGLFCGAAVLLAARKQEPPPLGTSARIGIGATIVLVGVFALVGLVGNTALASSSDALRREDYGAARRDAERAKTWAPWSTAPLAQLGEIALEQGRLAAARAEYRAAIRKDPGDWQLWFQLALASRGRAHDVALARAHALNPLSPEIAALNRAPG